MGTALSRGLSFIVVTSLLFNRAEIELWKRLTWTICEGSIVIIADWWWMWWRYATCRYSVKAWTRTAAFCESVSVRQCPGWWGQRLWFSIWIVEAGSLQAMERVSRSVIVSGWRQKKFKWILNIVGVDKGMYIFDADFFFECVGYKRYIHKIN